VLGGVLAKGGVFFKHCVESRLTSYLETCTLSERGSSVDGYDNRSMTPWFAKASTLLVYDDKDSLSNKVKLCLQFLSRQPKIGWALFNIDEEVFRRDDCDMPTTRVTDYGRIKAVRNIMDAYHHRRTILEKI
ncbi:unnamed protein product, partial [Ixodes persulcatus]